jgi:tyrosinase
MIELSRNLEPTTAPASGKTMKLSNILVAGLASGADALKFQVNVALAAEGMLKLSIHLAKNGVPAPGTCTLDKVSIRREW